MTNAWPMDARQAAELGLSAHAYGKVRCVITRTIAGLDSGTSTQPPPTAEVISDRLLDRGR